MSGHTFTTKQREALRMLERAVQGGQEPHGVYTSGPTALLDGQAWINWRTAQALEAKGRVRLELWPGEGGDIFLLPSSGSGRGTGG